VKALSGGEEDEFMDMGLPCDDGESGPQRLSCECASGQIACGLDSGVRPLAGVATPVRGFAVLRGVQVGGSNPAHRRQITPVPSS